MHDPQLTERIKHRVSESYKKYLNQERRSELLLRNPQFIGELWEAKIPWLCVLDGSLIEEISGHALRPVDGVRGNEGLLLDFRDEMINKIKSGALDEYDVPKLFERFRFPVMDTDKLASRARPGSAGFIDIGDIARSKFEKELKSLRKKSVKEIAHWLENEIKNDTGDPFWEEFCRMWRIDPNWDGYSLGALHNYVLVNPLIISSDPNVTPGEWKLGPITEWEQVSFIHLRIEPWTEIGDIVAIRSKIKEAQRIIYGYSERDKRNFARDLCWYDLHTRKEFGRQSYGRISEYWKTWGGDKSHGRNMVIQAIRRIRRNIDRLNQPRVQIQFKSSPKE